MINGHLLRFRSVNNNSNSGNNNIHYRPLTNGWTKAQGKTKPNKVDRTIIGSPSIKIPETTNTLPY